MTNLCEVREKSSIWASPGLYVFTPPLIFHRLTDTYYKIIPHPLELLTNVAQGWDKRVEEQAEEDGADEFFGFTLFRIKD